VLTVRNVINDNNVGGSLTLASVIAMLQRSPQINYVGYDAAFKTLVS